MTSTATAPLPPETKAYSGTESKISRIFRDHGPQYLETYGERMPPQHKKALWDIAHCRTEAMGGHVEFCPKCGHERYSYHSCGNSSCPVCSGERREKWAADRAAELLPVTYFHVVFTIPQELRELARANQKLVYGIMFQASAKAMETLAADPKFCGGRVGMLSVLHTWNQTLGYHPHIHMIVSGGGLSRDKWDWLPSRGDFLVPLKPLGIIYRAIVKKLLTKAGLSSQVPREVWDKYWHIYSEPSVEGSTKVVNYLAKYVFRTGISDKRISNVEDGFVTIQSKNRDTGKKIYTRLTITEFIRRFLQHVLPHSFVKVRYYGLWATCRRPDLRIARHLLGCDEETADPETNFEEEFHARFDKAERHLCPQCKQASMIIQQELPRTKRRPFW